MSYDDPSAVEKRLVSELNVQLQQRNSQWLDAEVRYRDEVQRAEEMHAQSQSALDEELAETRRRIESEHAAATAEIETQFQSDESLARGRYNSRLDEINQEYNATVDTSRKTFDDTQWMVTSVLDENTDDSPQQRLEELTASLQSSREFLIGGVESLAEDIEAAKKILRTRRQRYEDQDAEIEPVPEDPEAAYECCESAIKRGRAALHILRKEFLSKLFVGATPVMLFAIAAVLLFILSFLVLPPSLISPNLDQFSAAWIGTLAGTAATATLVVLVVLYAVATGRCESAYQTMIDSFAEAEVSLHNWRSWSDKELRSKQRQYQKWQDSRSKQRDTTLSRAESKLDQETTAAEQIRDAGISDMESKFAAQLSALEERRTSQVKNVDERRDASLQQLEERESRDAAQIRAAYETSLNQAERSREEKQSSILQTWNSFWENLQAKHHDLGQRAAACGPELSLLRDDSWRLPDDVPEAIPFGHFNVELNTDVRTEHDDAKRQVSQLSFPLMLPFATGASLFLQAEGAGRQAANDILRAVMLRLLTSLPGGKVRFTIIDAVGLGEQFSSFMHLADYDELLVNSRIWTESGQIEQRLADLTEHMENVFQTYLRNEYQSIEEYNDFAGEVAEPYHFLVIANFPANFTEVAARRLVSIAGSGARCGVHTLISYDCSQPLPHGLLLEDVIGTSTHLVWRGDHFEHSASELNGIPLELDAPPQPAEFGNIVRRAGELSKHARKVEVPFSRIAPTENQLWQKDSRGGIDVPLGRAGATKLQHLRLGKGTSQHVLVAGKTGSGKSTFLHTLITNTALHYGPDEVELYLIDFKKGVEFKAYAAGRLPHARVIAIESDREFGVSVLQRLDAVLTERGELFRAHGAQDIGMFRDAQPDERMPRILLLVDEFQEFFTEDDKLSQTASLLLDRLVRQGRAFGIHVLLGSQTLGGAYSLARSTLGQVAVRIALQCSESDAHLILSEDNTAARLLTRPGEAIYNDANGLIDGNHPFQIAWLDDDQRAEKLEGILQLTHQRGMQPDPAIVFEGNIPADPSNNPELNELASSFPPAAAPAVGRIWLGEPVQLKAASALELSHQTGSNLLIVGQSADSALGILTSCLTSLSYQYPLPETVGDAAVRFAVLDAVNGDFAGPRFWLSVAQLAGRELEVAGPAESNQVVSDLAKEIDRRLEENSTGAPPIYLFVANVSGFRDLRKAEDDFGSWGMDKDKPASPDQQFSKIVTDGPAVGVHALVWCDSYNNVGRWLGNRLLKEFEYRVCFRMNANDSSQLIDTPAAGRLGTNRALLYRDATGETEKFRPYGIRQSSAGAPNEATAVDTTAAKVSLEPSAFQSTSLEPLSAKPPNPETAEPKKNSPDDDKPDEHWDSIEMFSVK